MSYISDREFAELHMPNIKKALGNLPSRIFFDIDSAMARKDMEEATDLVISVSSGDIAVRIRRREYWDKGLRFGFDWSIRSYKHGNKTEIHKLREGFARWYFFGYSADDKGSVIEWWLIDMDKVRKEGVLFMEWVEHDNHDGTMGMYISIKELAGYGCIVAHEYTKVEDKQLSLIV